MSKGSKPSGNITQTTTNPLQQAQQPYLTQTWDIAKDLYQNQPQQYYPGQTLSQWGRPEQLTGLWKGFHAGDAIANQIAPAANQAYQNAISGGFGVQNSPAYGGFQQYAQGTSAPQSQLAGIGEAARQAGQQYANAVAGYAPSVAGYGDQGAVLGNQYGQQIAQYGQPAFNYGAQAAGNNNVGLNSLMRTAQGDYLNSNPYSAAALQAAMDPVVRNYQTAVAPSVDASFSQGGRYGSGAYRGAVDTSQQNLGRTLGDMANQWGNAQYQAERQLQNQAAQQYGGLVNQGLGLGITGANAAGNLQQAAANAALAGTQQGMAGGTAAANVQNAAGNQYMQGLQQAQAAAAAQAAAQQYGLSSLQSGYNTGNQAQLNALQQANQLAALQLAGPQAQVTAGQGMGALDQATLNDLRARYEGTQNQPWLNLGQYQRAIGGALPGSEQRSQPYFQNDMANALSGISGVAGIGNQLGLFGGGAGGLGGLGGLFGAAAPAAGAGAPFLIPGMAASLPGAAGATAAATGLSSIAPLLGMAAPAAAWIICTELTRQRRLPRKHWAVGLKVFEAYPEIAKRGYYVWAIPSVRHLRRKPDSLYSRFLGTVFRWRAEDIAARQGVRGARRLWRGRAVTAALVLPCLVLGALCRKQRDWRTVYQEPIAT